jgi:hypothetical protein
MRVVLDGFVLALADALGPDLALGIFIGASGPNPRMLVNVEKSSATAD